MNEMMQKLERTEGYLAADPGNTDLLGMVIDLSLSLGLLERAAAHAAAALERYPDDAYFRSRQGSVCLARRDWAGAAAIFAPLLGAFPDVNLAYNLAYAYVWMGRHADACLAMEPYMAAADLSVPALTLLVRALHHSGDSESAMALVDRHLPRCQGEPDFLAAASLLYLDGDQLERAGQLSEAALAAAEALGRVRRPLEALVVAGTLALAGTDAAMAVRHFDEVIARSPAEGRAWSALGAASLLKQDLPAARTQLEQALVYLPKHIGSWHLLGWCHIFGGDLAGAHDAFATALALDRNFGESHGGMAVVQAMRGERELAEASIARALGLDAQGLSARYAQMVLSGATADPARFRALAGRLLSSRKGAFGLNINELLARHESR
jgi:tetratricopeptide (TPR) repeat protein